VPTQVTSFTLNELQDRVRGDLGLRGSGLITETDVLNWARDITREAARSTQWYRVSDAVDATVSVADYDLPATAITLLSVAHDNIWLGGPVTFEDLDRYEPYWRSTGSGTPYLWYRRGFTGYTLYPTPDETLAGGIKRVYTAIPAMPDNGADTFDFPQACEQLLISYCLYRGALKDATGEGGPRVAVYQREYMMELERLKESVSDLGGEALVMGVYGSRGWRSPTDVSWRTVPQPGPE
jgi:hypothetical protein